MLIHLVASHMVIHIFTSFNKSMYYMKLSISWGINALPLPFWLLKNMYIDAYYDNSEKHQFFFRTFLTIPRKVF